MPKKPKKAKPKKKPVKVQPMKKGERDVIQLKIKEEKKVEIKPKNILEGYK